MSEYKFRKSDRLRKQSEFDKVYENNVYAADNTLVVQGSRNEIGRPRLGLAVSRRVGNAVVRNRWKRLIREAMRLNKSRLPPLDLVVRPRKGSNAELSAIAKSLVNCAQRIQKRLEK